MESLVECLQRIKNGNVDEFEKIEAQMKPALGKYTRLMYKDEQEDIYEEFRLALWEAIVKMEYCETDGQAITYLLNAIRNRFYELYRSSCKKNDHECFVVEEILLDRTWDGNDDFENVLFVEDMRRFLKKYKGLKLQFFSYMVLNGWGDSEIAQFLKISRQYVNRLRKQLQKDLKEYMNIKGMKDEK